MISRISLGYVGKTAFLNLLLYAAAQLNVNVVLHHAMRLVYILRADGTVRWGSPESVRAVPELWESETLYLFNPNEMADQAFECRAFTVIATSPDVKHYANHVKHANMSHLLLPPWTKDEITAAHRAMQPGGILTEAQIAVIEQRYDEVGGSIRYSFYEHSKYKTYVLGKLKTVSLDVSFTTLQMWIDVVRKEESASELKIPHLLFHLFPSQDDEAPGIACLRFASKRSAAIILEGISVQSHEEWRKFLDVMLEMDPTRTSLGLDRKSVV